MTSYPKIWINEKKKKTLLTNHRVGTFMLRQICKIKGYYKVNIKSEININHRIFLFTKNPYYRFLSTFLLLLQTEYNHGLLGNLHLLNLMNNIERRYFNKNRKYKSIEQFNYCLKKFIKYFDKFIDIMKYDGHWLAQTDEKLYNSNILEKTIFIKFENIEKKYIQELFNQDKLPKKHTTNYKFPKNKYINNDLINFVNKYYKNDFIILNYDLLNKSLA